MTSAEEASLAARLDDLLARQERTEAREAIRECLYRYCRGIDRADEAALRSAYWPDGIDDHVLFNGNAYEFIDWCMPLLKQVEHSQHLIGNVTIVFEEESTGADVADGVAADATGRGEIIVARVESYYHAYERRRRSSGAPYEMFVGGRYLDRFEKRGGEWRIKHRTAMWDWYRHFRDSADLEKGVFGRGPVRMSGKFPDDPVYSLFER